MKELWKFSKANGMDRNIYSITSKARYIEFECKIQFELVHNM